MEFHGISFICIYLYLFVLFSSQMFALKRVPEFSDGCFVERHGSEEWLTQTSPIHGLGTRVTSCPTTEVVLSLRGPMCRFCVHFHGRGSQR